MKSDGTAPALALPDLDPPDVRAEPAPARPAPLRVELREGGKLAVSGVPFFRPREASTSESPYRHVREESHRSPRLPSVKELSDDIGDFYH